MTKIEINLLPKELRRKSRGVAFDKYLIYFAGLIGILVVLFVAVSVFQSIKLKALDAKIAEAQKRTNELKSNIELVDALTELKDKILARMSAIEALDRNRSAWVRVLEDLSKRVPDYLWLSLLKEEASVTGSSTKTDSGSVTSSATPESPVKKVTIEGYSYSLNSLASFLIQLMQSQYFKNMELQYVKRAETKEFRTFSFQLVGDLYYLPEVESPGADTAVHELALRNGKEDSDPQDPHLSPISGGTNSDMNLAVGRK
jgi:Tfp pilus assembly protein PilN